MRLAAAFCAALALPCHAGPSADQPLIDFDLLFQTHASEIVQDDMGARLDLPGGVIVHRSDDGSYIGMDTSDRGAVGCLFGIMEELRPLVAQCDGLVPEAGRARFDRNFAAVLEFLAANAVPPRPVEALRASLSQAPVDPAICAEAAEDLAPILDALTGPASAETLRDALSVPRLPVTNPCL